MLRFSKKSDYAIIALAHLARNEGSAISCREISEKFHIPLALLSNIMKALTKGGIVRSVRGARGGYQLAVSPRELSLGTFLNAMEGPIRLVHCMEPDESDQATCQLLSRCPIRAPVRELHNRFREWLDQVTLEDIATGTTETTGGGEKSDASPDLLG